MLAPSRSCPRCGESMGVTTTRHRRTGTDSATLAGAAWHYLGDVEPVEE